MIKAAIVLLVISAVTAYAIQRMAAALGLRQIKAMAVFLPLTVAVELIGPFGDRLFFPGLKDGYRLSPPFPLLDWLSYLTIGLVSCLFVYAVAADLLGAIAARSAPAFDYRRRAFLTLGAGTLGTTVVGVAQASAGPEVRTVTVPIAALPPAFEGFRIVQISDLHVGTSIGRDYVEKSVSIANGLNADLIALTGDFIDGTVEELKDDVAPLADLQSACGCFYVTGNHEYYWGAEPWLKHFDGMGFKVLLNGHRVIDRNGDRIVVAGIPDLSTLRRPGSQPPDMEKALDGAPPGLVKVLLAHQPASYQMAADSGFDLQLSGHTHAGQYFPMTLLIRFFQRYTHGLNRHESLWVYVNRGTGFWGPPLRTANPAEITLLILTRST